MQSNDTDSYGSGNNQQVNFIKAKYHTKQESN